MATHMYIDRWHELTGAKWRLACAAGLSTYGLLPAGASTGESTGVVFSQASRGANCVGLHRAVGEIRIAQAPGGHKPKIATTQRLVSKCAAGLRYLRRRPDAWC